MRRTPWRRSNGWRARCGNSPTISNAILRRWCSANRTAPNRAAVAMANRRSSHEHVHDATRAVAGGRGLDHYCMQQRSHAFLHLAEARYGRAPDRRWGSQIDTELERVTMIEDGVLRGGADDYKKK